MDMGGPAVRETQRGTLGLLPMGSQGTPAGIATQRMKWVGFRGTQGRQVAYSAPHQGTLHCLPAPLQYPLSARDTMRVLPAAPRHRRDSCSRLHTMCPARPPPPPLSCPPPRPAARTALSVIPTCRPRLQRHHAARLHRVAGLEAVLHLTEEVVLRGTKHTVTLAVLLPQYLGPAGREVAGSSIIKGGGSWFYAHRFPAGRTRRTRTHAGVA